jgi:hypothetical protein
MLDEEYKPYRPVPRTIQQAFGPYHRSDIAHCRKHERLVAIVGTLVAGVVLGLLFGWRG